MAGGFAVNPQPLNPEAVNGYDHTYLPRMIALIWFRISFREGMVDGIILSGMCL